MKELTIEEKAQKYDEAKHIMTKYLESGNAGVIAENTIKKAFPELGESDDEKIRNDIIQVLKGEISFTSEKQMKEYIAYLEKLKSVSEIVERCKKSWYNEGKIDGKYEGITDDVKYQQGWHDALEKQGEKINAIENFDTEFEKQVSYLIASVINKEYEYNQGYVKWIANTLLNYAKHEFEKQSEQKPADKA